MIGNSLFRSSAFALLALMTRGATVLGQQPVAQGAAVPPAPVKMMYDKDAKTGYSVAAYDKVLTVRLWVADSQQQRKVLQGGLELWIDVKGKKNKTTGILFPQAPAKQSAQKPPALQALLDQQKEIKLVGFGQELDGLQNPHHPSGIDVTLRRVNDTLFYDARIPLHLLAGLEGDNPRMSVGIIEKGIELPDFPGGGMPGMGGPPPGGDGVGPGGPPPGDGPPGMMDIELFHNNTIWYKFNVYR